MRRCWMFIMVLRCFTWSTAREQTGYAGLGISDATCSGVVPDYPTPSFQVGGPLEGGLELRGTLESLLIVSDIGLDVLYLTQLTQMNGWRYSGLGGNVRFFALYPNGFDLRGVFRGEFPRETETSPIHLFAEMRLYLKGLFGRFPTFEGRAGINFRF